jgi:hypothetical protein
VADLQRPDRPLKLPRLGLIRGMRGKHLDGVSFPLKLPLTLPDKYIIDLIIE